MNVSHSHSLDPAAFWHWFAGSERRFRDLSGPKSEALLEELHERLRLYCTDLYFEVGGAPEHPVELVISAGGNASAFACVRALVSAAPPLPAWTVIAFKQPHGFSFTTRHNGILLDPRRCMFQLLPERSQGGRHWLRIACPGYVASAAEDYAFAAWTALDRALGEGFVSEHILEIELCSIPRGPVPRAFQPLPVLATALLTRGVAV